MAIGEISENPSDITVTRSTASKTRDEDIERKLRLYGIFQAFRHGKLPSNKQINVALTGAVESNILTCPSKQLSWEGRTLVKDLRDVIDSSKYLWLRKNYNEEFQNFLFYTIHTSTTPNFNVPLSEDQVKGDGERALQGLRTLGRLLVTNGQFRKLLEDATLLARDMVADGASKAIQTVRPKNDRLAKIDEPAEDHTWHEAPPSIGEMKTMVKSKINVITGATQGVQNQGQQEATQDASCSDTGQSDLQEARRRAAVNQSSDEYIDLQAEVNAGIQSAEDRASAKVDQIPDKRKEKANQVADNTKAQVQGYLKEKVPKERRNQTIYRLKKMIVEIQQHEDYLEAVDTLISLAEEYIGHAKAIGKDTNREMQLSANDPNVKKARQELKTLLENFADWTSMDDMFDAADDLINDANNDREFNRWVKNLDHFVRKCLREDGYILKDESIDEWNKLSEQGRYFLNDRYKEHSDRLRDEVNRWLGYMANDPDSIAFGTKVEKLFLDLGQDKNGNIRLKSHLLKDVTDVIIPGFLENLRYIPIPRIEVGDPKIDAVVENLVIESENLMPNILEIQAYTFFRFGRKKIHNRGTQRFTVHVSQIQCDLKDIAYYIKKKQGFLRITDIGVMDIFLGGQGLSFDIKVATADEKDRNRIFKVENVKVKIKNLNIVLKESNHKTLFNFFKPLLLSAVKPAISKAAEVQIRRSFDQLDEQVWLVQKEYNKAKEAAKDKPPEETENTINMYIHAIEKRITQRNEDAKKRSADVKVNVTYTKETSMFPNIRFPGGISTKAEKYREIALEGDEWQSPIFDLGTAKASPIPEPKKITRKSPHQYSRSTISERANEATSSHSGEPQASCRRFFDSAPSLQETGLGSVAGPAGATAGYISLNSGGYDNASQSTGNSGGYNLGGGLTTPGSHLQQDPMLMPHTDAKDTHVAS